MLHYALAPAVTSTAAPPIPKAKAWGAAYAASPVASTQPLLDLSQGVPGTAPADSVLAALAKTAGNPDAAKYGPILGESAMRAALAVELRNLYSVKEEASLLPEDVGITTGCNMAFLVLLMVLCPPNESSILLPLPAYFNHAMSLSLQGVTPSYIPCDPAQGFQPSIDAARHILAAEPKIGPNGTPIRPRAIVLTTPNNPTGAVYSPSQLEDWLALARKYEIPLVLDETYREFTDAPHTLFDNPTWRESLISLGSFSKGYRIPGHRLGSITASPTLLEQVATVCDCMQICPPRPPQLALAPLLPSLRDDLAESAAALRSRLAIFAETVANVPGWRVLSSGGFYAYVEFPKEYTGDAARQALGVDAQSVVGSEDVGRALAMHGGVLTLPGCFFMPARDSPDWDSVEGAETIKADRWIRFAIANVDDDTVRALGARLELLNKVMGM